MSNTRRAARRGLRLVGAIKLVITALAVTAFIFALGPHAWIAVALALAVIPAFVVLDYVDGGRS